MTSKEKYRKLCNTEPSIPIFSRDWWLDIVCGNENWDVFVEEENGRILATLPYFLRGKQVISMPPHTQTMGPWFAPLSDDTKYTTALAERQRLCNILIKHLEVYPHFLQNFHYTVTDWLPFYWAGYKQTTRYTYRFPYINNMDKLYEQMSSNIRRNISKAKEKYHIEVRRNIPIADFMAIYNNTFDRKQKKAPDASLLERVIHVCSERNQGDIWGGYDESGQLHAVSFIVWQESSAYYIAGGGVPELRDSGAHAFVMSEAIKAVSEYTNQFDFEGSMLPGVERFFREFGAIQTPFFTISKGKLSLIHRAWLKLSHK